MNTFTHVPPGFRFHPTDEELVNYYLRKKIASRKIDLDVIKDVDLYKIEPWDLQDKCKVGAEEQNDWYFFSHKDKKYPTGTRTNRATTAGFWKATGRDKPIYSKNSLVGMRKTLVFYKGRAPNGQKSDWIMHEYRLETNENAVPQEEGWVVCRVFKKRVAAIRRDHELACSWYVDDHVAFMPDLDSPKQIAAPQAEVSYHHHHHQHYPSKPEVELHYNSMMMSHDPLFLHLPQLESPKLSAAYNVNQSSPAMALIDQSIQGGHELQMITSAYNNSTGSATDQSADQVTDWRVLDKFVASQLMSHDDASKIEPNYSSSTTTSVQVLQVSEKQETAGEYASTSNSSSQIDLWK